MSEIIWTEKYRPQTVDACILPDRIKSKFKEFVEGGVITNNLLLSGTPGVGKTTIALAAIKEIDAEYMFVNASTHGNIDTLRGQVAQFASTMSFNGQRKYVIFDEAERLTPQTQDGIRGFVEEYSSVCGFIFTCNNPSKINEAIKSRTIHIDFNFSSKEVQNLLKQYFKRIASILKNEEVQYDKADIGNFIVHNKNALDFRNLLIQIQYAVKDHAIKAEDLRDKTDEHFEELVGYVKNKKFDACREWIHTHSEYSAQDVFRKFFDCSDQYVTKQSKGWLIKLLAEYQYKSALVVDQEINLAAFFVECMADLDWK